MGSAALEFAHWRCRLQRLSDSKLHNGWVSRVEAGYLEIQLVEPNRMAIGDGIHLEMATRKRSAFGRGQVLQASEHTVLLKLEGDLRLAPPQSTARRRVMNFPGTLTQRIEKSVSELEVLDIGERGIGCLVQEEIPTRTIVDIQFRSPVGPIACSGSIRYCRMDPYGSGFHRVGIEFSPDGAPAAQLWDQLMDGPQGAMRVA